TAGRTAFGRGPPNPARPRPRARAVARPRPGPRASGRMRGWSRPLDVRDFDRWRRSVLDDAGDAAAVEPVAALQEVQLDEEREADDVALQALDELDRALHRAAGGQEVVDDQDLLAGLDRVAVDLERVRPVFEGVLDGDRLRRQLAELPDR